MAFKPDEISDSLEEWEKRVHPEDRVSVYRDINNHINGFTPIYVNEHRILCKDGNYKWILDRGRIISWSDDGKPLRMVGTHTDMSNHMR